MLLGLLPLAHPSMLLVALLLQAGRTHPSAPPCYKQMLQDNTKMSMLRNATWTLSNFCRGKPQPDFQQVGGWGP